MNEYEDSANSQNWIIFWGVALPLLIVGLIVVPLVIGLVVLLGFKPSAERLAFTPVTANAEWTPYERDFDDMTMVLVPAGCFMMRAGREGGEQCFDKPFWIGKYQVTNAQYARFIDTGGYANPAYWTDVGWEWRTKNNITQPDFWTDERFNTSQQPVVGQSWYEAFAYARWAGGYLPSEAQWEYAARGPDGLQYPWGNEFDASSLNFCDINCEMEWHVIRYDDGYAWTSPVGSYPDGASWVGALDMSGNVWEWSSSVFGSYPYDAGDSREDVNSSSDRTLRGGTWYGNDRGHEILFLNNSAPEVRSGGTGFRIVRTFEE